MSNRGRSYIFYKEEAGKNYKSGRPVGAFSEGTDKKALIVMA
jgi:hypothetical protein